MNPETLKQTMAVLDFNTGDVAIVTGVTRRMVQMWLSGSSPVPLSAFIVLEAIREGLVTIEWLEDKILQTIKTEIV
jgi:hypothetical protein